MKIYTKTGDTGETSLFGGVRITKAHHRLEAYGTIDELNAHIGLISAHTKNTSAAETIQPLLKEIQQELFVIGSHLATQYDPTEGTPDTLPPFPTTAIERLEKQIDRMDSELPKLTHFILPTGTIVASELQIARTVCRRAERAVIRLSNEETILPEIIQYLNRLSDFLFTLARLANHNDNVKETIWQA